MSYIDQVLQPGEQIVHRAKLHWFIYLHALATTALAAALLIAGNYFGDRIAYVPGVLVGIVALYAWLGAWIRRSTTELAVTNRRIIIKRGWISRRTIEMNMDKVESVDVLQSLMGRIFDYGDIVVRGTGSGLEPLRTVGSPLKLRSFVTAR
ncbi:MAG TPA: PH domain-containing protein [Stellaceae bacterium]|nr:PH domain-containing protein [Stellaceae bacterium]